MAAIWKAKLELTDEQDIAVPEGAELLSAREQFDDVCIWFKCNPQNPMTRKRIRIAGEGHHIPDDGHRFLGTAKLRGGSLMFHIFEINT